MDLSTYREHEEALPIKFGDDVLNIRYRPNYYTPRLEEIGLEARTNSSATSLFNNMMIPLLASWDLEDVYQVAEITPNYVAVDPDLLVIDTQTGELVGVKSSDQNNGSDNAAPLVRIIDKLEKKPVPITVLGLTNIPFNLLTEVMTAVGKALSPGEEKPETSKFT